MPLLHLSDRCKKSLITVADNNVNVQKREEKKTEMVGK
jgi:hypothetical protein